MEERSDYQSNVPSEGQNPGEMGNVQQGMYGPGPGPGSSGEAGAPAEREEYQPKWVIGRTVLGILSILLFILVVMQSCAAGLGNVLSGNGEVGGSAGFFCAVNLLVAGLIVLVARKTVKKAPMIVAAVLMFLNLFYGMVMAGSYSDLRVWAFLSFAFGLVYLFSALREKKQFIIAGIISAVFFALIMAMGMVASGSLGSGNSGAGEANKMPSVNVGSAAQTEGAEQQNGQQTGQQQTPAGQNTGAQWEVGQGRALTYKGSNGSTMVRIMVPVTNTGDRNLYVSPGTMDLEDAGGHLVDSANLVPFYPQILAPGETGWYYHGITLNQAADSELSIVPHVNIKEAKVECIRYEASEVSFMEEKSGGLKAIGRITNTTAGDGTRVIVVVFLYDAEENLVGQTHTWLDGGLKAGETIGFSMPSFGANGVIDVDTITGYRLYAYPVQDQY